MKLSRTSLVTGALIQLAIQALLYWPAVTQGYFHADDWFNYSFYQEYSFGDYALGDWGQGRRGEGGYYRPLSRLYFNANYAAWGLWAPGHHLGNFALHFANVLLLWAVARRLMRSARGAFAAALLFALFPAHPSAVHWISGATDLIHAFWYLAAINLALAARMGERQFLWAKSAGVLVCFICALLSKETAVGLPFVLFAIEWVAINGGQSSRLSRGDFPDSGCVTGETPIPLSKRTGDNSNWILRFIYTYYLTLAAFVLLAVYLVFRRAVIGGVGYHVEAVLGRGILGPSLLSFLSSLMTLLSPAWSPANLAAYGIVLAALLWPLRRSPGGIIAAVWLLMAMAPMAGIIVSITDGGWLLYLPAAAWCVIMVEFIYGWMNKIISDLKRREFVLQAIVPLLIIIYLIGSYKMEWHWRSASRSVRASVESSIQFLSRYVESESLKQKPNSESGKINVIVPDLTSPDYFPAPILSPTNSLHKALAATIPQPFSFRDHIQDNETSPTLVLICQTVDLARWYQLNQKSPYAFISLFRLGIYDFYRWSGDELRDQWSWGSGIQIETGNESRDINVLEVNVNDLNDCWMRSPVISRRGSALNLLILDFETPVLTEGKVDWLNCRGEPDPGSSGQPKLIMDHISSHLVYNDPGSRQQPRRIITYWGWSYDLICDIYPIREVGQVEWRGVEWRQYPLELIDATITIKKGIQPYSP